MEAPEKVSVLIPCRNEEKFINHIFQDLDSQDYPKEQTEVFFIDGQSADQTASLIKNHISHHENHYYLENTRHYVPFALNLGIEKSSGAIIVRMDAHCRYPVNYISELVKNLKLHNADNVGGIWITKPANSTLQARAIAIAQTSPFGIGNAQYRLGADTLKQVDTVPFGCYRKSIFDKLGLFDEELLRNQDDEFNGRITKHGGKILLIPNLEITYFARATLLKTWKTFYQYGLFKPLVNRKLGEPTTLRQFIPPLFVIYLFLTLICLVFALNTGLFLLVGVALYFAVSLFFSIWSSIRNKSIGLTLLLPWMFFVIHFSYGWGYLSGIIRFWLIKTNKSNSIKESR